MAIRPSAPRAHENGTRRDSAAARRGARPGSRANRIGSATRELEPRQRRADAEMDAGAEAHMRVRRPAGVEGVGIGKALGIAVGGAEQKADLLALPQPHAGELDLFQRIAGKEMQRRVEPQQFLDRRLRSRFRSRTPRARRPPARAWSSRRCRSPGPSLRDRRSGAGSRLR